MKIPRRVGRLVMEAGQRMKTGTPGRREPADHCQDRGYSAEHRRGGPGQIGWAVFVEAHSSKQCPWREAQVHEQGGEVLEEP